MKIHIHIERIVLDGLPVPYHRQAELRTAVEKELGRLFTSKGPPNGLQSGGAVPHISADRIQWTDENHTTELGQQIARSVYGGLGRCIAM